ncbi:hypothetical protein SAMD00019534_027800 [Acytostelium subglobosum LB1]|uniref:hypothetical protein n=1 Tax=Acytostelium subglobosum LB1 TaxID=1410327 RepID=UPI0006448F04|nr:hypothetical protein SAMD00019534_027800 [Acytostelium subglobosum LB1]GAM19605.1 hypothetical protein SAMD00019534_027800 [Acytostelium subglobosum LB1]|eukprot:XP_012756367.1 hypothetical protein SAMD00019534_027800 [Acytostelium subglobosum LB1]
MNVRSGMAPPPGVLAPPPGGLQQMNRFAPQQAPTGAPGQPGLSQNVRSSGPAGNMMPMNMPNIPPSLSNMPNMPPQMSMASMMNAMSQMGMGNQQQQQPQANVQPHNMMPQMRGNIPPQQQQQQQQQQQNVIRGGAAPQQQQARGLNTPLQNTPMTMSAQLQSLNQMASRAGMPQQLIPPSYSSQSFGAAGQSQPPKGMNIKPDDLYDNLNEFPALGGSKVHQKQQHQQQQQHHQQQQQLHQSEDQKDLYQKSQQGVQQQQQIQPQQTLTQQQQQQQQRNLTTSGPKDDSNKLLLKDPNHKYGLLGLLSTIKTQDVDVSTLTIGIDLTCLGLNLNSASDLSIQFGSPWYDVPVPRKPEYYLPTCYSTPGLESPSFKMSLFTIETLFYIFYSMPKDILQICAALELYHRDWKYHRDGKVWLKKDNDSESTVTNQYEAGTFALFDANQWEIVTVNNFIVYHETLETKEYLLMLLSENNQ